MPVGSGTQETPRPQSRPEVGAFALMAGTDAVHPHQWWIGEILWVAHGHVVIRETEAAEGDELELFLFFESELRAHGPRETVEAARRAALVVVARQAEVIAAHDAAAAEARRELALAIGTIDFTALVLAEAR